jgi:hypothetical protein
MADILSLRSQIKSWERDFKTVHARDPTIQDIKLQPQIGILFRSKKMWLLFTTRPAEKYKLYKKLSKAAAQPNPPRPPPSLLLSKPRVVQPTPPLSLYNPFSPVKNKNNQLDTPPNASNAIDSRGPSSDTIKPFYPIASTSSAALPAENAVSRARKRLRGEPVSPSPNKEKRRRTGSNNPPSLPFSKFGSSNLTSDDYGGNDDDDDEDAGEANSSFVDDSPVKAPAGSKSFKLLFEESIPATTTTTTTTTKRKGPLSRSKTTPASSAGLFKDRLETATSVNSLLKEDTNQDLGIKLDRHAKLTAASSTYSSLQPAQGDIFSGSDALPYDNLQNPAMTRTRRQSPSSSEEADGHLRKSTKRPLSDVEDNIEETQVTAPLKLLPPSPPPADSSSRGSASNFRGGKEKGKGKATAGVNSGSRKRVKVQDDDEDDYDQSSDEARVKLVNRTTTIIPEDDPDPILGYDLHRGLHEPNHDTNSLPSSPIKSQIQPTTTNPQPSPPTQRGISVDLPDKFKRVLSITPIPLFIASDPDPERVVRGLLTGRRAGHYDPDKGGEIWDVGEHEDGVEEGGAGDGEVGEEDWEGEGVPWEVGQL